MTKQITLTNGTKIETSERFNLIGWSTFEYVYWNGKTRGKGQDLAAQLICVSKLGDEMHEYKMFQSVESISKYIIN